MNTILITQQQNSFLNKPKQKSVQHEAHKKKTLNFFSIKIMKSKEIPCNVQAPSLKFYSCAILYYKNDDNFFNLCYC